ncbi:MAG TPA: ATP-grasp domain-containing protein [Allosphingosinicella sp.]|nr:ATP-grasp domain-containing protein [Allosphingosinicella sp.]
MSGFTILLTSAGRRVSLLNCFRDACRQLDVPVRMLAADLKPDLSAACAVADTAFTLPPATDPDYAHAVEAICARDGVDLVIPTIDTELLAIAEAAPRLATAGVKVNISTPSVIKIARDKLATSLALAAAGVATPQGAAFGSPEIGTPALPFPLIAKPRGGSSSIGIRLIETGAELASLPEAGDYLLQERLEGREYTVNVYVDAHGVVKAAVPHLRIETRAGEVSKGRTERHPAMTEIARKLVGALPGARGALCFQCFVTDTGPVVFEINARFGGGYPLAHAAGARFAQWLVEEALDRPSTASDAWQDGLLMLRHDSEIFL